MCSKREGKSRSVASEAALYRAKKIVYLPGYRGIAGSPSDGNPSKLCATLDFRGDCAWTKRYPATSQVTFSAPFASGAHGRSFTNDVAAATPIREEKFFV